jgi:predicted RNase H-like nuclease (RuvC/YqgF family)
MTTERWTDESLDRFASTVAAAITANNEQIAANSTQLMRIGQLVESNNRFLEALGQDLRRYSDNMDRLSNQLANATSNANQDRMESTTRLSAINRKVDAIARHLGVDS